MDAKILHYIADVIDALNAIAVKYDDAFTRTENGHVGNLSIYWYDEKIGEVRDEIGGTATFGFYPTKPS